jgi:hypothetical protein
MGTRREETDRSENLTSHLHLITSSMEHSYNREANSRSVSIGLEDRSSIPGRGRNFVFDTVSRPTLRPTQPPNQWVPGVRRPEREGDHSHPSSAEVKIKRNYTSTPPYVFTAWYSAKPKDNFTLTFFALPFYYYPPIYAYPNLQWQGAWAHVELCIVRRNMNVENCCADSVDAVCQGLIITQVR